MEERKTGHNSTLAIGGVSSPLDSFVVAESSLLRTNFCAEKPANLQNVMGKFKKRQRHIGQKREPPTIRLHSS
jgi:hypothetical protein